MTRTGREYLFYRTNPKGVHAERWLHAHGCQRWFNALRDTVSDRIVATYAMGERAARTPDRGRGRAAMAQSFRLAARRPHRSRQADRHAVQRPAHRGVRRRYGRFGAACQRHPLRRAVVQVSPAARRLQPWHRGAQRPALRRSRRGSRRSEQSGFEHRGGRGLSSSSQNHWPSLGFDVGAINDVLSPLLVAGFYYKTFMWPRVLLGQAL